MKHLISYLISAFFFNFCFAQANKSFIPTEYQFPVDSIGNGKTFVYSQNGKPEYLSYSDIQILNEGGKQYIIKTNYDDKVKKDSSKSSIDGKLLETYLMPPNMLLAVKGTIEMDTIIIDGTKLGKYVSKKNYKTLNGDVEMNVEVLYSGDTILTYNGNKIDCIVTKSKLKFEVKVNGNSVIIKDFSNVNYYGKALGLIKYKSQSQNESATWELYKIDPLIRNIIQQKITHVYNKPDKLITEKLIIGKWNGVDIKEKCDEINGFNELMKSPIMESMLKGFASSLIFQFNEDKTFSSVANEPQTADTNLNKYEINDIGLDLILNLKEKNIKEKLNFKVVYINNDTLIVSTEMKTSDPSQAMILSALHAEGDTDKIITYIFTYMRIKEAKE